VSCVTWKDQSACSIETLRSALDKEFEYVGNNLSAVGFKNAVKRQMKTERHKMKAWFLSGKKECPVNIQLDQWARLCDYWTKPETNEKAIRMANARRLVKNTSNVGRAGRAGKEAQLVCVVRLMLIARQLMFVRVMISCCSIPCTFMVSPGHRI
jgi:hypothetical protein